MTFDHTYPYLSIHETLLLLKIMAKKGKHNEWTTRRSAGVPPEVNQRNQLRTDDKACMSGDSLWYVTRNPK